MLFLGVYRYILEVWNKKFYGKVPFKATVSSRSDWLDLPCLAQLLTECRNF